MALKLIKGFRYWAGGKYRVDFHVIDDETGEIVVRNRAGWFREPTREEEDEVFARLMEHFRVEWKARKSPLARPVGREIFRWGELKRKVLQWIAGHPDADVVAVKTALEKAFPDAPVDAAKLLWRWIQVLGFSSWTEFRDHVVAHADVIDALPEDE